MKSNFSKSLEKTEHRHASNAPPVRTDGKPGLLIVGDPLVRNLSQMGPQKLYHVCTVDSYTRQLDTTYPVEP